MIKPEIPDNEEDRIQALVEYQILDTLEEDAYDQLTRIASDICDTPIALISLVDPDRQWFKSHHGLDARETPRELAFCAHAINQPDELFVIPDASKDERFHDNPLCTDAPNVIFYAGAPLNTPEGYPLGTLCVIDSKPRELTAKQLDTLQALANQVISQLELRKKNRVLEEKKKEADQLNKELDAFSYRLSHDLKTPLRGINNIIDWLIEDHGEALGKEIYSQLTMIKDRSGYMDALINGMLKYSRATKSELSVEDFNLKSLIEEVSEIVNEERSCNIEHFQTDQTIRQSQVGLKMCLQNLLSNSMKYGNKEDCQVKITLSQSDGNWMLKYEDNGPGIPPEYHERVFEMFETMGQKSADSTGIGLATVRALLERLEGSIIVRQRENEKPGVLFIITVPVVPIS